MRVATLNVQNLKLETRDGQAGLLGARDGDVPSAEGLDRLDRRLTARLLADADADVLALQEVYDQASLDHFYQHFLLPAGLRPYAARICPPGNDGRGFDVALLSRRLPQELRSHAPLTLEDLQIAPPPGVDPLAPVFRRDCLMASIGALTLFIVHFKSPYPDPAAARTTRHLEALATRRLVERYFRHPERQFWLILGDTNEPARTIPDTAANLPPAIAPLLGDFSVDLMQRLPETERWTYFDPHSGRYHRPDALLASPALARAFPEAVPVVLREGMGAEARRFTGPRLQGVGTDRPHASDHAAVLLDLPGL